MLLVFCFLFVVVIKSKNNSLKLIKYNFAMSLCVCCMFVVPVTKLSAGLADFAFRKISELYFAKRTCWKDEQFA